jgi:hypothetical protein
MTGKAVMEFLFLRYKKWQSGKCGIMAKLYSSNKNPCKKGINKKYKYYF